MANMNESDLPSPSEEHSDVSEFLLNEPRDPVEIRVQQLWVTIEMAKREKKEGNFSVASSRLQEAKHEHPQVEALVKTLDASAINKSRLLERLATLKTELDGLIIEGTE